MVGEKDSAYGRRERCEKFAKQIAELKSKSDSDYPVEFMFKEGFGHGGLPDRDMIGSMYDFQRNPTPKHLTWEMTDSVVDHFFWLSADQPKRGSLIDAKIEGNRIVIETENLDGTLKLHLDRRLIDASKPINISVAQRNLEIAYQPSVETLCKSVAEISDIELAYDFETTIEVAPVNDRVD